MQTVLIMAVGALILLGVNRLYRQVSPTIRQHVQSVVSGEMLTEGSGGVPFSFGTTPRSSPIYDQASITSPLPDTADLISNSSGESEPSSSTIDDETGSADREEELRKAEHTVQKAIYFDRLAEFAHLVGDQAEQEKLRKASERLKLAAAEIRDGERGVEQTQKQIDAASAMRDLVDFADNGSDLLPKTVQPFYKWAKIPIRDGLPQVTESIVSVEQKFHQWLAAAVADRK